MDRKSEKIWETKLELNYRQDGICPVCREPVSPTEGQLAHRIPQSKWALAKYGPAVIHHRFNMALVHGKCNDAVSISNHPVKMEKLAEIIREELDNATDTE